MTERRALIDRQHRLPVTRQCRLLDVSRSSAYYRPQAVPETDLALMREIDEIHLKYPFYGTRRVRDELQTLGYAVNRKRVRRLMRRMGLVALYPKPRTSIPGAGHTIYPYRLKGLSIDRPNQVWATDITFIPMAKGFMYLIAIMDWRTRKVLTWRVSNTMDTAFCLEALEEHRPRGAVYLRGIYRRTESSWHHHQHGRQGPLDGQRVCRALVAFGEIRGSISESL